MKIKKNGVVVSNYPKDRDEIKVARGDLHECPECGHQIVAAYGRPYMTRYKDGVIFVK